MSALPPKMVTLPDGNVVELSDPKTATWCLTHDGTGYIDPKYVAPDPDQPRRHMNAAKLAELEESVATAGVREPITVTPLSAASWVHVASEYAEAFFAAVSGHRRWSSASKAVLKAIPIRVKFYADEAAHREDASLLNGNREDLTPLEEGLDIIRQRELGRTIDSIAKHYGCSAPQIYNRINLTRLHPSIQLLIDPEIPTKQRLPTTVAGTLGGIKAPTFEEWEDAHENLGSLIRNKDGIQEPIDGLSEDGRRFALQLLLLAVIQQRSLNMGRAIELIKSQTLKLASHGVARSGPKSERLQPRKRREIVANFAKGISDSVLMDWGFQEFRRVYELAPKEEMDELISQLEDSREFIGGFIKILTKISSEKRPTPPEALRLIAVRKEEALRRARL